MIEVLFRLPMRGPQNPPPYELYNMNTYVFARSTVPRLAESEPTQGDDPHAHASVTYTTRV